MDAHERTSRELTVTAETLLAYLLGNEPFPWQRALLARFLDGEIPSKVALPTGLGKTAVMAVWLAALATRPAAVPRRLVYVVNRRTVVDQATRFAEQLRERLTNPARSLGALSTLAALAAVPSTVPLAISTLRGQFADNREWARDPARPAILVGTVDMVGSRLLFSGYRSGFKLRPLDAGFLGVDTLVVHDEAHLEPAFQALLTSLADLQHGWERSRGLRVMELSATTRGPGGAARVFALGPDDERHPVVSQRIRASKRLALHAVDTDKAVPARMAELAAERYREGRSVVVFCRTIRRLDAIRQTLETRHGVPSAALASLTGTMRGLERDRLVTESAVFRRFLPEPGPGCAPVEAGAVLLATSAGEVGVDMSADDMVCDLAPFESMAQRLGRVNRFGLVEGSRVDVVHEPAREDTRDPLAGPLRATLALLHELDGDASPRALGALDAERRALAFSPPPATPRLTDVLLDSWSLTTIREPLPARPPVADWLHGIEPSGEPETEVAWRAEVGLLGESVTDEVVQMIMEACPLRPHELLRERRSAVVEALQQVAGRVGQLVVWMAEPGGEFEAVSLRDLDPRAERLAGRSLAGATLVLPVEAGGLGSDGRLDGRSEAPPAHVPSLDVGDLSVAPDGEPERLRVTDDPRAPAGMRLALSVPLPMREDEPGDDGMAPSVRYFFARPWSASASSWASTGEQLLADHLAAAERVATRLADALRLPDPERAAVVTAAALHDLGKARARWQLAFGNEDYPAKVVAKGPAGRPPEHVQHYRHELGSLLDAADRLTGHPPEVADLALHLIAAHHGRARPWYPAVEAFDVERPLTAALAAAGEVPRRFERLQRRYGRWGLAYLESLVRAADYVASDDPGVLA